MVLAASTSQPSHEMSYMEKSEARQIVNDNMPKLMLEFGISHWRIDVFYCHLEAAAECDTGGIGSYDRAVISIDNDHIETKEKLIEALEHELLHVIGFPMIQYGLTIEKLLPDAPGIVNMNNELFRHFNEQLTRNLERLVFSLRNPLPTH